MPKHRLIVFMIVLASVWLTVSAQESSSAYPTLNALDHAVVPQADPAALAQQFRGVGEIEPPPVSAPERSMGEEQTFWVVNSDEEREFEVQATLRVVGEHIYLWVENGVDIPKDELQALADAFDHEIYPAVRELWGSEASPGVDGDPRLYGLFARGLGSSVAAYFASRHTYPAQIYPTSNEHEMFFFNLDALGTSGINNIDVESTIAHEFQHMIRANIQDNDDLWMNEGFSSFTQLYLYGDTGASWAFLSSPYTQFNTWAEETWRAPNYGASMLFVAYFYERYGLDALRQVSLDRGTGLDAFNRVLESLGEGDVNQLFADWALANYFLDYDLEDGRYGYDLLPAGMPGAAPVDEVTVYPYRADTTLSQYATDYYTLSNLDSLTTLDVSLAAPDTVQLIPTDAASGRWMWYSNRGDLSDMTLTQAFDLSSVSSATLNYKTWYDIEDLWDYAYVVVSTDGGESWEFLRTPAMTDENPHSNAYAAGYSGVSRGWVDESIPLDAYAGQEILLRFQMITDDGVSQPGIAIDNVSIPEIGYSSDFETDGGGWEASGWIRIDNVLPQQVWVQVAQRAGNDVTVSRWLMPDEGGRQSVSLDANAETVVLAVSPFAPETTVPMDYSLKVSGE